MTYLPITPAQPSSIDLGQAKPSLNDEKSRSRALLERASSQLLLGETQKGNSNIGPRARREPRDLLTNYLDAIEQRCGLRHYNDLSRA